MKLKRLYAQQVLDSSPKPSIRVFFGSLGFADTNVRQTFRTAKFYPITLIGFSHSVSIFE